MCRFSLFLAAMVLVSSAGAAPMVSINPMISHEGIIHSNTSIDMDLDMAYDSGDYPENESDPSAFSIEQNDLTQGRWLFGSMIEASSSSDINIAFGADLTLVRFAVEQKRLVIYEDDPNIPEGPGITEGIVNRYPCDQTGNSLIINLTEPEISRATMWMGNSTWSATSGNQVYNFTAEKDYIGWVEKFLFVPADSADEPVTIFLRFFFKRHTTTGYTPKNFSNEDMKKFGFFRTKVTTLSPMAKPVDTMVANRLDLSKPITFYIHPNMPEKYRAAVKEGILTWNDVFEASNGIRPIEVLDGEPWMLPSDIRYKVIYWVDHILPGFGGAYGPSTADPATGEILDGDVVIFGREWIAGLTQQYNNSIQDEDTSSREGAHSFNPEFKVPQEMKLSFSGGSTLNFSPRGQDPDLGKMAREMLKEGRLFENVDEFLCTYFKGVMCHEVGHTLGLRHNFSASADLKNLNEGEVSTSIMDYLDFEKMTEPGIYDYAAISYGYDGDESLWREKDLVFFTDEHADTVPDCNRFDEGDPFEFYLSEAISYDEYFTSLALEGTVNRDKYINYTRYFSKPVRKYVASGHDMADEAFAFFYNSIIKEPSEDAGKNEIHFYGMRGSLLSEILLTGGPYPLSQNQKEHLIKALSQVISDDSVHMSFRINAVKYLKYMSSESARSALKKANRTITWHKVKSGINVFKKTCDEKKKNRNELSARIKQTLDSYFD